MAHPLYVGDLEIRIKAALAAAEVARAIDHNGLLGAIREILVRELLRPILPPHMGIGSGKIVDHVGNTSSQMDIIIFDRSIMPPLFYGPGEELGVFPVEACVYAIEVKSTSNATEFGKAIEVGRSLGRLRYLKEACGSNGNPINRVIPAYFAFGSDLRAPTNDDAEAPEIDRWRKSWRSEDQQWTDVFVNGQHVPYSFPSIRVLCTVGQGYGFYAGEDYLSSVATEDHREIISFVTGIANSLFGFSAGRMTLPFGYYLGGPTQDEVEPRDGLVQDTEQILARMARTKKQFDANDALAAVIEQRLLHRGPEGVLGNAGEIGSALAALEHRKVVRQIPTSSGAQQWEYLE